MTDHTTLIERLEAASEASRELDALVYAAITDGDWSASADGWIENSVRAIEATPVTFSLDAALDLAERLLPGWDFVIARANGGLTIHAQLGSTEHHFGNTPALALCIAILRATGVTVKGEP